MNTEKITVSTLEEYDYVDDMIIEYNNEQVPFTQDPVFIHVNRVIKNKDGEVIAGINSILYCWNCMAIDVLWVKENYRNKGYGEKLLHEVEKVAIENGCRLIQLDSFDFQAKDFYLKNGYVVFGVLDDCPIGHKRYYMKKDLI